MADRGKRINSVSALGAGPTLILSGMRIGQGTAGEYGAQNVAPYSLVGEEFSSSNSLREERADWL